MRSLARRLLFEKEKRKAHEARDVSSGAEKRFVGGAAPPHGDVRAPCVGPSAATMEDPQWVALACRHVSSPPCWTVLLITSVVRWRTFEDDNQAILALSAVHVTTTEPRVTALWCYVMLHLGVSSCLSAGF